MQRKVVLSEDCMLGAYENRTKRTLCRHLMAGPVTSITNENQNIIVICIIHRRRVTGGRVPDGLGVVNEVIVNLFRSLFLGKTG